MWYYWWGYRRNLKSITLGSERVNPRLNSFANQALNVLHSGPGYMSGAVPECSHRASQPGARRPEFWANGWARSTGIPAFRAGPFSCNRAVDFWVFHNTMPGSAPQIAPPSQNGPYNQAQYNTYNTILYSTTYHSGAEYSSLKREREHKR